MSTSHRRQSSVLNMLGGVLAGALTGPGPLVRSIIPRAREGKSGGKFPMYRGRRFSPSIIGRNKH